MDKNLDHGNKSSLFNQRVAVVIPCYRVKNSIVDLVRAIGSNVERIYLVDDCCPDGSLSEFPETQFSNVTTLRNLENLGVGGAVKRGYEKAIDDEMDVIVKIDGDGQMDPSLIPAFIAPILRGEADYTKGNRFYELEEIHRMPVMRVIGNAGLSFVTKVSSGYWDVFDPTNGFTAIHSSVLKKLPLQKISNRYFFESDMLFRLNVIRAVVEDIPMDAKYGDEISNLKIHKIFFEFLYRHVINFLRRIFYNYYLRDMSLASFELPVGLMLFAFGAIFGFYNWQLATSGGPATTPGTVMIAALPILGGFQLILAFLAYDIASVPKLVLHTRLADRLRVESF
jgi:glycosyltransferase involved in cell wall biosynthesis